MGKPLTANPMPPRSGVDPNALPMGFGFGVSAEKFDSDSKVDLIQITHDPSADVFYKSFLNRTIEPPIFANGFED
jgi:hypothetical protein